MHPELRLTTEQLGHIELEVSNAFSRHGVDVDSVKIADLKGGGHQSQVYSILINDAYHVLKIYSDEVAYEREFKTLEHVSKLGFGYPGVPVKTDQLGLNMMVFRVHEGRQMQSSDLTLENAERLADKFSELHINQNGEMTSAHSLIRRIEDKSAAVLSHCEQYDDLDPHTIKNIMEMASKYVRDNEHIFNIQRTLCHGDPSWANIIVGNDLMYFIDWEYIKYDDPCEELAQFRILIDYRKAQDPYTFWNIERSQPRIDSFMNHLISRYAATHLDDDTILKRYGFYAAYFSFIIFADNLNGSAHGAQHVKDMLLSGIDEFSKYCLE